MSIRFQADADLNFDIVKAVRHQEPAIDFASPQIPNCEVSKILRFWNGQHWPTGYLCPMTAGRCSPHFRDRLAAGKSSPGLLVVPQKAPIGPAAESLVGLWSVSAPWSCATRHITCRR